MDPAVMKACTREVVNLFGECIGSMGAANVHTMKEHEAAPDETMIALGRMVAGVKVFVIVAVGELVVDPLSHTCDAIRDSVNRAKQAQRN